MQDNPGGGAWWLIDVNNNIIVNNVTGLGGGGIALQDALRTRIDSNTISRNDSAAAGVFAFEAGPDNPSTPQVAGILSRPVSPALAALTGLTISVPETLSRNILWRNRSFFWDPALAPDLQVAVPPFRDLTAGLVCDPFCILSSPSNPFTSPYVNTLTTAAAADEGGNFVQVYYTPLRLRGDYSDNSDVSGPNGGVGAGAP